MNSFKFAPFFALCALAVAALCAIWPAAWANIIFAACAQIALMFSACAPYFRLLKHAKPVAICEEDFTPAPALALSREQMLQASWIYANTQNRIAKSPKGTEENRTAKSPESADAAEHTNHIAKSPSKRFRILHARCFFTFSRAFCYLAYATGFWLILRYFGFFWLPFFTSSFIITLIFLAQGLRCLRQ